MSKSDSNKSLGLRNSVGPQNFSHPSDIIRIKEALFLNGAFPNPRITGKVDQDLYEGIQKFQRSHGLDADAVINPDGPTDRALAAKSPTYRCVKRGAPHGGLYGFLCPSCGIKAGVGPVF